MPVMTKREFGEQVAEYIRFGMPENDRYIVELTEVTKQGGAKYTGVIIRTPDSTAAPTIYLDDQYERYLAGRATAMSVAGDIIEAYEQISGNIRSMNAVMQEKELLEYEKVKKYLRFRIVEIARNQEWLADKPYIPVGNGLAKAFYLELDANTENVLTSNVTDQMMEIWGCNIKQFEADVMESQIREKPPIFMSMSDMLAEMVGVNSDELSDELEMYVLTCKDRNLGASCLYYPGVMQRISEIFQGNYYVLPSSTHEVIIVPAEDNMEADALSEIVSAVNREVVSADEILSDHVMFYNQLDKRLYCPLSNVPEKPQIPIGKASENMRELLRKAGDHSYLVPKDTFKYGEIEQLKIESQALGVSRYFDFDAAGGDMELKEGLNDQFDFVEKNQKYIPDRSIQKQQEIRRDGPRI